MVVSKRQQRNRITVEQIVCSRVGRSVAVSEVLTNKLKEAFVAVLTSVRYKDDHLFIVLLVEEEDFVRADH